MKVFKFGGASLKNADAVRNIVSIIKSGGNRNLVVVVSAMGKTTDAIERVIASGQAGKEFGPAVEEIGSYHAGIIEDLSGDTASLMTHLSTLLDELKREASSQGDYDFVYDQVIGYGEIISSLIVHHALLQAQVPSEWIDSRNYVKTDSTFREGKILWDKTDSAIDKLRPVLDHKIVVAQGFIGANEKGETVSLGREGSDFSAAIFGSSLAARSVTIWKDVPGVMSADPKRIADASVFEELPYKETAEMTYY
ncbi:MAG TPA: hypothetical protein VKQ08_09445, partial [Cyclobacteriaceae bacterium]|nr:hypothetical protein [Cyclobacteriaceae bacterium]